MILTFQIPNEPFNSMVKDGTAGPAIQEVLGAIKPEHCYFSTVDGTRGGIMIAGLAEPLFLNFDATVDLQPCMTPEDLANAGLDKFAGK
ncbi:MAG: panthothenate synthetase [Planctomycetota bacterium]